MPNLFLFTASYPYGSQESFLEDEIAYLSRKFDKITIIPLGGKGLKLRQTPSNCIVDNGLHCHRSTKIIKGLLGFWRVLRIYCVDFYENNVLFSKSKLRDWMSCMLICSYYMQSKPVKEMAKIIKCDDVIYSYWGTVYNSVMPFFYKKAKLVSRYHGDGDLWKSNKEEGYKPLREVVLIRQNASITISYIGEAFLKERHPYCTNIHTFHLGSFDNGECLHSTDGVLRILSCSSVYPLKRVDLIYKILSSINVGKIEWTHIGDGESFKELCQLVDKSPSENMKIILKGKMAHSEVIEYYKNNLVDLFINLSTNEGVPVSIMEAISFNVPVIATNVGGNSEIVNEKTGVLVSSQPDSEEIENAIKIIKLSSLEPRKFWKEQFNAAENYAKFADYLLTI